MIFCIQIVIFCVISLLCLVDESFYRITRQFLFCSLSFPVFSIRVNGVSCIGQMRGFLLILIDNICTQCSAQMLTQFIIIGVFPLAAHWVLGRNRFLMSRYNFQIVFQTIYSEIFHYIPKVKRVGRSNNFDDVEDLYERRK